MDKSQWKNRIGVTPGKLVVVGVLGAVFVTVICFQLGAKETPVETRNPDHRGVNRLSQRRNHNPIQASSHPRRSGGGNQVLRPAGKAGAGGAPDTDDADADMPATGEWPETPLEMALAHDPFALPPPLAPPPPSAPSTDRAGSERVKGRQRPEVAEKHERALAAVRDRGIQMVLVDQEERVAIVGDRAVRVGEVLEGLRVVAISADGITLSETGAESE
ncbi:MAG: hypothetical protein ACQESR_12290 [Planctomycetota bacterium]